jgi:hypothetical protein
LLVQTTNARGIVRTAVGQSFTSVYLLAVVPCLLLWLWGAWAQFVPNPDAGFYLRSAELFAGGHWREAAATYGWPTYGLLIAGVMRLTGVDAFTGAQILNAVCSLVIPLAFVSLVRRLSNDRLVTLCAAIVIVLQPELAQLRSSVIRDNGYLALLLLVLYWVACDITHPRLVTKLATGAGILAAGLFRIEGFVLVPLVLIYYLIRSPRSSNRRWAALGLFVAALLIVPGILAWSSGSIRQSLAGDDELGAFAAQWDSFARLLATRLSRLKDEFLYPAGGGNSWGAYVGMTLGIATVNIVRAVTIPLAILTSFAFFPRRLMARPVNAFVLWFAFGQLPMLLLFTFVALFLDRRYATGLALVLNVALAFLLAEAVRLWQREKSARWLLPVVATSLLATWAFAVPRPTKLGYLKQAGQWVGRDLPATAAVLTNDMRIAYFSGRPYGGSVSIWTSGRFLTANEMDLSQFDYFVLQVESGTSVPAQVRSVSDEAPVRTFPGADGGEVVVYLRKAARERAN